MIYFNDYMKLAPNSVKNTADVWLRLGQLEHHYNESHRHYHNLVHIQYGYQQHWKFFGAMSPVIFFAWTYHDSIYNPEASTNEEQSAKMFLQDNEVLGFNLEDADKIVNLILSTTHTGEKNLITDIDLSGLGAKPDVYDRNTHHIRQEYAFADDKMWKAGRSAFIQRFLADRIFYSPQFIAEYEEQARENMLREFAAL